MASYKDITPSKFSPYVPTRPVEAMMRVGMYKQQKFDEGLKKIQDNIDNVAGLDVVRPEDKEYLQSKLNQLGGQISNMAGGDFSNFSLVNSVNGMTNQIVKDPAIMNAVSNTAKYKKDLTTVDKLNSEGKWAPSNQAAFQKDVNNWFQGGKDATYNANVSPYVNVTKEATDIIKALGKKVTGYDVAFNERGQLVDAITKVRIEGIGKRRIETALKQGLSPQALRQLSIDGLYKYSNTSPEQYVQDINSSYNNTFSQYLEDRDKLVALQASASSTKEKLKLQEEINEIDNNTEALKSEYNSVSSGFKSGDVEQSQAQLYTMNWFEDTSNAYATESSIRSYHTNPFAQMQMQRDKLRQDAKIAEQTAKYQQDRLEIERKKLKLMKDPYGSISIPTNKDATSQDIIASMESAAGKEEKQAEQLVKNFLNKYKVDGQDMTGSQFLELLERYNKRPNSVSWDKRADLDQIIKSKDRFDIQNNIIIKANDEADKIFENELYNVIDDKFKNITINGFNAAELSLMFKDFNRDYLTTSGGPNLDSKNRLDVLSGISAFPSDVSAITKPSVSVDLGEDKALADFESGDLGENKYGVYQMWAASRGSKQFPVSNENIIGNLEGSLREATNKIDKQKQEYIKDYYQQNYLINQEVANRIPIGSLEQKDEFRPVLNSLAVIAERSGGLGTGSDVSAQDIRNASTNLESAIVTTNSDGNYNIIVQKTDGASLEIPIGRDQYNEAFGDRFEASPSIAAFNDRYLSTMLSTPTPLELVKDEENRDVYKKEQNSFYTTAKDGEYETTLFNSFLHGPVDFPNVNYYSLSGNIISDSNPKESTQFKLKINIYNPIDNTLITDILFPAIFNKSDIVPTLMNFTDEAIWQLLNESEKKIPNEVLKQLQESSKVISKN